MIVTSSFGQFLAGITLGIDAYRWDRIPMNQTDGKKISTGGIFSETIGLNLGFGNEKYRFLLDGYQNYAPFSFSLSKFQGMGTFSGGAMARISFTPFEGESDNKGFTLGVGIETNKAEIFFRKEDVTRKWFPTKYVYMAYSMCGDVHGAFLQGDYFVKVGKGDYSALNFELGIRCSILIELF
jgi:hypothetical protein